MINGIPESNKKNLQSKKAKFLTTIQKLGPIIFYLSILFFYFSFFLITYFAPLLFPDYIQKIPFINFYKNFHRFYDERYKNNKGKLEILIEFGIMIELYILLIFSFYKVSTTNSGHIPEDDIWNIVNISQVKENLDRALKEREELLNKNNNILNQTSEMSTISTTNMISINTTPVVINERTTSNGVRYCNTCMKYKPDRSHHCKYCNKCILKMDHHCPWIGNCIGFKNYKFFIQMVFYGLLNSIYFLMIYRDVIKYIIFYEKLINIQLIFFIGAYFFMIIIIITSFLFLCFHLMMVAHNYTTYEYMTKVVRTLNSKKSSNEKIDISETYISRYDIGLVNNFRQVFGDNLIMWFIPYNFSSKSVWNNGFNFKVNNRFAYEIIKSV